MRYQITVSNARTQHAPATQPRHRCRTQVSDVISIHVRLPKVEDHIMPGHWENDFVKGGGNQSAVSVLVERSSRLVLLAHMEDATAAALAAFTAKLSVISVPLRQSSTNL